MGAIRSSTNVGIRLAGALLLVVVLAAGLLSPSTASAARKFAPGDPVVVNDDDVNVRTRASTSAPVRTVASAGDTFTIGQIKPQEGNGRIWYRVSTATRANFGWIAEEFLDLNAPFGEDDCVRVIDGALNLRSRPSTNASIKTVLDDGTNLRVLNGTPVRANGFLWYQVDISGFNTNGWVVSDFIELRECGNDDEIGVGSTVRVVDGPLNAREEPDLSADILRVLPTGEGGIITDGPVEADGFTWFEFRNLGGVNEWIVVDFIAPADDVDLGEGPGVELNVGDAFVVDTDALNVRSSAGLDGVVIDTAAGGAVGERIAGSLIFEDDFTWVRVNIPGVGRGWVVLNALTAT